jgi:hypothetical protein
MIKLLYGNKIVDKNKYTYYEEKLNLFSLSYKMNKHALHVDLNNFLALSTTATLVEDPSWRQALTGKNPAERKMEG